MAYLIGKSKPLFNTTSQVMSGDFQSIQTLGIFLNRYQSYAVYAAWFANSSSL